MAKIHFVKDYPSIEVNSELNLMDNLLNNNIPVASSCHGDGICSKCRIQVTQGIENLSSPNDLEEKLNQQNHIPSDHRISCQCHVNGDITIDTGYW